MPRRSQGSSGRTPVAPSARMASIRAAPMETAMAASVDTRTPSSSASSMRPRSAPALRSQRMGKPAQKAIRTGEVARRGGCWRMYAATPTRTNSGGSHKPTARATYQSRRRLFASNHSRRSSLRLYQAVVADRIDRSSAGRRVSTSVREGVTRNAPRPAGRLPRPMTEPEPDPPGGCRERRAHRGAR